MIDYFAIALTHGLIALAAWRLFMNDELDNDPSDVAAQDGRKQGPGDA